MPDQLLGMLGLLFTFGMVVLVHEFGHFIVAKMSGVCVETFSLGFGKKLWKRRWGETEYCISMIPFGGYVQLKGTISEAVEEYIREGEKAKKDDNETPAEDEDIDKRAMKDSVMDDVEALRSKPYLIKVAVFAAGVTLNLIMGVLTLTFIFWYGVPASKPYDPVIGHVKSGSSAQMLGLMVDDRLTTIGSIAVNNSDEIYMVLGNYTTPDSPDSVDIGFYRNNKPHFTNLALPTFPEDGEKDAVNSIKSQRAEILNDIYRPFVEARVIDVNINMPAEKAGMQPGDLIVAIDGVPISNYYEMQEFVVKKAGVPMTFTVDRNGEKLTMDITPSKDPQDTTRGVIGVSLGNVDEEDIRVSYPLGEAFLIAVDRCILITKLNFKIIFGLIVKREWSVIGENVGGPVAIGVMAYKYAQKGIWDFLNFFAIINVIIAVMNLIPFPIFDGGHIALATYESATKKSVPPKVLLAIYQISLFLIIALAVLVTANDIWRQNWRIF